MKIGEITHSIGGTPLIRISEGPALIYAKAEHLNPGLSLKDRIARSILEAALERKEISAGSTVVCASSGNTGHSIAMLAVQYKLNALIVTSEKCSEEKRKLIRGLGAELIVRPEDDYMDFANQYAKANKVFNIDQYNNPDNPEAYYRTVGPEIWEQTNGKITHFVMTGSTYGCISGTARYLKEKNPSIEVILVDPEGSNIAGYFDAYQKNEKMVTAKRIRSTLIEGAGKSSPTGCLDFSVIDRVIKVSDKDAVDTCLQLSKDQEIIAGGSSGMNVFAARLVARELSSDHLIVTVLCDHGSKYKSKIYNPDFLKANNLL